MVVVEFFGEQAKLAHMLDLGHAGIHGVGRRLDQRADQRVLGQAADRPTRLVSSLQAPAIFARLRQAQ
jgi:hypothetical protein